MTEILILILFLILVAVIARVDFIVYIAYVLIGIYALSRWYVPRSIQHLSVSRVYEDRAFLGEPVEVKVDVSNTSRLPILWLQLTESVPPELRSGPAVNHVLHLGPKNRRTLRYRIRAMKRGYYRLGPLQITIGDLFGFQQRQAALEPSYLTVYPRIVPLTKLNLPSRTPFGTVASKQRIFEDPSRPHGVRDYHLGDSLRFVNWKVSAHAGNLLVRTHEPAISLETTLMLNLNSREYSPRFRHDGPEWAIVVAASLASHLIAHKQAVGLLSNGLDPLLQRRPDYANGIAFDASSGRLTLGNPPESTKSSDSEWGVESFFLPGPIAPGPGRAHLMQILELLARLESAATLDFADFALRASHDLNWGVTLIAIVPDADQRTCDTLHRLMRRGFNVVLLVIEPYASFSTVRERAKLLGFSAFHVTDRQALQKWQEVASDG